jgi:hypothetical protein
MTATGSQAERGGKEKTPMPTFTIDVENNVTAFTTLEEAAQADANLPRFSSQTELTQLTADWPPSRLIDLWNSIPGNSKVAKLGPPAKAAARIWKALLPLAADSSAPKPAKANKAPQLPKRAKAEKSASKKAKGKSASKGGEKPASKGARNTATSKAKGEPRDGSKKAEIITLMQRAKGVSLPEIQKLTSWQKHTVRGFISLLGSKAGLKIISARNEAGERTYRIAK